MSCPLEKVPPAPSSSEQGLRPELDPGPLLGASLILVLTSPHTLNNSISQCWDLGLIARSLLLGWWMASVQLAIDPSPCQRVKQRCSQHLHLALTGVCKTPLRPPGLCRVTSAWQHMAQFLFLSPFCKLPLSASPNWSYSPHQSEPMGCWNEKFLFLANWRKEFQAWVLPLCSGQPPTGSHTEHWAVSPPAPPPCPPTYTSPAWGQLGSSTHLSPGFGAWTEFRFGLLIVEDRAVMIKTISAYMC